MVEAEAVEDVAVSERVLSRTPKPIIRLDDLPLPERLQPDDSWGRQMLEMADHIGPFYTLTIYEARAGERVWIPKDVSINPFINIVPAPIVETLSEIYGGDWVWIGCAKSQIRRAKRAGVLAACRAGHINGAQAAIILGTSRTYASHLLNQTTEGVGMAPIELPEPGDPRLVKRALDKLIVQLGAAGVEPGVVAGIYATILSAANGGGASDEGAANNE